MLITTLLLLVALLVALLLVVVLMKISNTQGWHTVVILAHSGSGNIVIGAQVGVSPLVRSLFNILNIMHL